MNRSTYHSFNRSKCLFSSGYFIKVFKYDSDDLILFSNYFSSIFELYAEFDLINWFDDVETCFGIAKRSKIEFDLDSIIF